MAESFDKAVKHDAGETGTVQPVRHILEPPQVAPQEASNSVHGAQPEISLGHPNAMYSQTGHGEERIPIDDILGKQGSLVRETSAIKAYPGAYTPQKKMECVYK